MEFQEKITIAFFIVTLYNEFNKFQFEQSLMALKL